MPILSDGKPDNQNCAIIFTRGHIIQAMDCNQVASTLEAARAGHLAQSRALCGRSLGTHACQRARRRRAVDVAKSLALASANRGLAQLESRG